MNIEENQKTMPESSSHNTNVDNPNLVSSNLEIDYCNTNNNTKQTSSTSRNNQKTSPLSEIKPSSFSLTKPTHHCTGTTSNSKNNLYSHHAEIPDMAQSLKLGILLLLQEN